MKICVLHATLKNEPSVPDTTESNGPKWKRGLESRSSRSTKGALVFHATDGDASVLLEKKLVNKTLSIYNALHQKLVPEDEASRSNFKQPDLKSWSMMMEGGFCVNRDMRVIRAILGVNVGALFYFRMELM